MTMTDAATTADAVLATATRLFDEFDDVPVMTVLRAINGARLTLHQVGLPVTPDSVEAVARGLLRDRAAA